ncbi:Putative protein of unknown function [Podospora comata]|uniref:Uncharacterized protein n=1 Tax=Podospora comata TaxID=48703 RepID=A0ABY6SC11_PODCO|nr:Putative protein of unknown function [Podospora comata]
MSRNPSRSNSPAPRQSTITESTLSSGFGDYGSPGIEGFARPPSRSSSAAAQRGSASTFSSTTAQRGSTTTTAGRTPSTPARPASPGPRPGSSGGVRPGSSGGGRPGSSGSAGSGDSIIPTEGNVPQHSSTGAKGRRKTGRGLPLESPMLLCWIPVAVRLAPPVTGSPERTAPSLLLALAKRLDGLERAGVRHSERNLI